MNRLADRCLTLRFSGSPTQLTKEAAHRRVRCKRLFVMRSTHQFRTKIQTPRAINKTEQAVTMIVGIALGSLKNMIVEAK